MVNLLPDAFAVKKGLPPTERNARTGEFTPPGIKVLAFLNKDSDVVINDEF